MVDIRPQDLNPAVTPIDADSPIIIDQGLAGVNRTTSTEVVDAVAPVATQSEAEVGTNDVKRMTALKTKQSIASEVGSTISSYAAGQAGLSAVQSVNGKSGNAVTLAKSDVGLSNVDNTSDVNKPVSTAQQAALNLKADKTVSITGVDGVVGGGDLSQSSTISLSEPSKASLLLADTAVQPDVTVTAGTGLTGGGTLAANRTLALSSASIASLAKADTAVQPAGLTKAAVGLGNVDNTSDANKPISTATQTALNGKASTAAVTTTVNGLMIAADKVKLNGIAAGAQVNVPQVQTDWNATTGLGSILNKPSLGAMAAKNNVTISDISSTGTPNSGNFLRGDGTWSPVAGAGTVTSVAMTVPTGLAIAGSPITGAGTLAVSYATGYQGYTTAEASKLAGIAVGAQVNTVTSVAGKTGAVTLAKGDVGLGNVDNTSDANKPVSTATQTALNGKLATTGTAADSAKLGNETAAQWQGKLDAKAGVYGGTGTGAIDYPVGYTAVALTGLSLNSHGTMRAGDGSNLDAGGSSAVLNGMWAGRGRTVSGGIFATLVQRIS